ncbi:MAG: SIR2 family protein [Bacteroidota bacterium]|uniref:SIR2 family protein n=1 Tax=Runella sp. TaxID=1960881 RepID=UPI00301774F7
MTNAVHPKPIDWDYLLDKIRDKECLVILGPEVFADASGETTQARLLQALDPDNNPHVRRYYKDEDFFLFDHKSHRTQFCHQIKRFYRAERPGELVRKLADIPFHIYLTITPDLLLPESFREKNFQFQHGYYKKDTDPQAIKLPSAENPLIYNLFGCIENEESLVLSHDDLYDYFKSIFTRRSMPGELKDELREIRNMLFIGIPFDKWHLQILLRELEIHNQQYAFTRFAANQNLSTEISTLCFEQFQIQFIDKNVDEFVQELHRRVEADPGINFRESAVNQSDIPSSVKRLITSGETVAALELLNDQFDGSLYQQDIDMLNGRYSRFKKRRIAGVLSVDEITLEENRINSELLELVQKLSLQA